jgi:hypothetical protein
MKANCKPWKKLCQNHSFEGKNKRVSKIHCEIFTQHLPTPSS